MLKKYIAPVLEWLNEHYEFVIAEVGLQAELCDALKGCTICHKWTSTYVLVSCHCTYSKSEIRSDSVACAVCRKTYHLQCLDPPLAKRPGSGYSWTCAPCALNYETAIENYISGGDRVNFRVSTVPGVVKAKGKEKEIMVGRAPNTTMKMTNGWPYRYFGQHTEAMSVLGEICPLIP